MFECYNYDLVKSGFLLGPTFCSLPNTLLTINHLFSMNYYNGMETVPC